MPQKINSNLGFEQNGSMDKPSASLVVGGYSGRPTVHTYNKMRTLLMNGGDPDFVGWYDDFLSASADLDNRYTLTLESSGDGSLTPSSPTAQSGVGVVATSVTSPAANDFTDVALGLHWLVSSGWTFFEARVRGVTSNLTDVSIEVGLIDALTYSGGLAFTAHATPTASTSLDGVVFAFTEFSSGDTTYWKVLGANNGTVTANITSTTAPSTSWNKLGLVINSAGKMWAYIDDALVGSYTTAAALQTTAVLTPFLSLKTLGNAQRLFNIDYWTVGGSRA